MRRSNVDPDLWFPVSANTGAARREPSVAIAICRVCPVRPHCLDLSLRHWNVSRTESGAACSPPNVQSFIG